MIRVALEGPGRAPGAHGPDHARHRDRRGLRLRGLHAHGHDVRRGGHAHPRGYDGTDAVVVTKTAFRGSQTADIRAQAPTIPASALDQVRDTPRRRARRRRHHRHRADHRDRRQAGRHRPVLRRRLRRGVARRRAADPVPAPRGDVGDRPRPGRDRPRDRESQHYAVGDTISRRRPRRGRAGVHGDRHRSFADVKSLGKACAAIFDLEAARTLFAKDGYDRILVAAPTRDVAGLGGAGHWRSAARPATTASRSTRSTTLVDILRTVLLAFAGVAVLVGGFTIFNSLSITVAQRTKEFGLLRMVGATRRQVRFGVLLEALLIGLLASASGIGVGRRRWPRACSALFTAVGHASCRPRALTLAHAHDRRLAARRHARDGARRRDPGAPRDEDRARRGAARHAPAPSRCGSSPAACAASRASSAARRRGSAAPPAGSPATTRCATPAAPPSPRSALMIGVALVTAVTVVAQGLKDQGRGAAGATRSRRATIVTASDGWSPIDPKIERRRRPVRHAVSSLRQDGALVFGNQEAVNAVDPASIGASIRHTTGRREARRHSQPWARWSDRQ